MEETNSLLVKIARLESESRRVRWVLSGLITMISVLGFLTLHHGTSAGKLTVTELTVKDSSGTVVARLGEGPNGTCLNLTARSLASKAFLCVDNSYGSSLDLGTLNPQASATLSAGRRLYEGGGSLAPGLVIEDGEQTLAVNLGVDPELLLGHSGNDSSVVLSAGSKPRIRVVASGGKTVWESAH